MVDYYVIETLATLPTRKIFDLVVEEKSIKLGEILERVGAGPLNQEVLESLKQLEQAGLIEHQESAIQDWNSYYVTAKGLGTRRRIKGIRWRA